MGARMRTAVSVGGEGTEDFGFREKLKKRSGNLEIIQCFRCLLFEKKATITLKVRLGPDLAYTYVTTKC